MAPQSSADITLLNLLLRRMSARCTRMRSRMHTSCTAA